jgi:hypothetical protein
VSLRPWKEGAHVVSSVVLFPLGRGVEQLRTPEMWLGE